MNITTARVDAPHDRRDINSRSMRSGVYQFHPALGRAAQREHCIRAPKCERV